MNTRLPDIQNVKPKKLKKSISFELSSSDGQFGSKAVLKEPRRPEKERCHGNDTEDKKTITFENTLGSDTINADDNELRVTGKRQVILSEALVGQGHQASESFQNTARSKRISEEKELKSMLRDKDREISRLQDIIRKMSLDRENAVCANANSRLRVTELKNKLSSQHREVEHVTAVERLRSKQRVSSETERLRNERDEARLQLAHHEKLVWQLRKQVDQLGYLSRQRYKTIQELGKKVSAKDKSLQEMRKRMEQAQLITVSSERRGSISVDSNARSISWEDPSRLATVNE